MRRLAGHGQRHGVFGHGLGAVTRHPQHCDAAALGGVQVHVIEPGAAKQQQFYPDGASVSSTGAEPSALTNAHTASPPAAKGAVSLSRLAAKKRSRTHIQAIGSQYVKV